MRVVAVGAVPGRFARGMGNLSGGGAALEVRSNDDVMIERPAPGWGQSVFGRPRLLRVAARRDANRKGAVASD